LARQLTKNEVSQIVDLYTKGNSLYECSKLSGRSKTTCNKIVNLEGITRPQRIYKVNENFFNVINTEAKAYWLGFIFADGSVRTKNNSYHLRIALDRKDEKHVNKFKMCINSEHPITFPRQSNLALIDVSSQRIVCDLGKYGVIPNKSLIANPNLSFISDSLLPHFWRGMLDGDGNIFKLKNKNRWQISLCGSYDVVLKFKEFVISLVDHKTGHMGKRDNIWRYYVSDLRVCRRVIDTCYNRSSIYLDRKKELSVDLWNTPVYPCFKKDATKDILVDFLNKPDGLKEISKAYGVNMQQVRNVCKFFGVKT
jgi:hypothetical protein